MTLCIINLEKYLDFNNDDYYNHGIDNCPDLKDSIFLNNIFNFKI